MQPPEMMMQNPRQASKSGYMRRRLASLLAGGALLSQAQTVSDYVDFSRRDPAALPTDTARIITPAAGRLELAHDPFDEYVPRLQSRYSLVLAPVFTLPYLHVPYLRYGNTPLQEPNFAVPEWLYVDLRLGTDLIYTDNVNHDKTREADFVAQIVLGMEIVCQLTDEFKLQLGGNLVYHHAAGEDSVRGFGFQDYFYFDDTFRTERLLDLNGNTLFATRAGWSHTAGDWEMQLADSFYIANRVFDDPFIEGEFQQATETANLIDGGIGHLLPGPCRLGLSGRHGNYWYDNKHKNYVRMEDSATLSLAVERDTMRFQPFAAYTLRHIDYTKRDQAGLTHEGGAGLRGPVTDQMNLEGSVAYSYVDDNRRTESEAILWRLTLDHLMNSTTRHNLLLERRLTPSATTLQGARTSLRYQLGHRFPHSIIAWLGLDKTLYDDEASSERNTEKWSFLASTSFTPARRMKYSLEYQFVDWEVKHADEGFTENRVTFSLAWDM